MMKPYLVDDIELSGRMIKQNEPVITLPAVCTEKTLEELKECLQAVCTDGTAKGVFKHSFYSVAGKTGTSLVANGNRGYADHIYQSSFVGYFPANHPKYSCIVVIRNKPFATKYLGASVAAPVFKNIADKLMSREIDPDGIQPAFQNAGIWKKDSLHYYYAGFMPDMKKVMQTLQVNYTDSAGRNDWGSLYESSNQAVLKREIVDRQSMPDVRGMGLRDALYLLENLKMKVTPKGIGKVKMQSVEPGTAVTKNQMISLNLN